VSEPPEIHPTFAGQARQAARDPRASEGALREGLAAAADIIDGQSDLIAHLFAVADHQRFKLSLSMGCSVLAACFAVATWLLS